MSPRDELAEEKRAVARLARSVARVVRAARLDLELSGEAAIPSLPPYDAELARSDPRAEVQP